MKKTLLFTIIISFLCCKNDNKVQVSLETTINSSKNNTDIKLQKDSIKICTEKKYTFDVFNKLAPKSKIIIQKKIGSNLYYAISKNDFNGLFNEQNITCITAATDGKYSYFDINYNKQKKSEDVFFNIKRIDENEDNLNKYHDFFKRGLVFSLNSKENKITIITFNIFANNSLPKKTINFFKLNKTSFEQVFMTTGIGTVQNLVE